MQGGASDGGNAGHGADARQPTTVAEIDTMIAAGRLRCVTSRFAGDYAEADFWTYEVARLQNLRNIILRQELAP